MQKTYITPAVKIISLEAEALVASSFGDSRAGVLSEETDDFGASNRRQTIWDNMDELN